MSNGCEKVFRKGIDNIIYEYLVIILAQWISKIVSQIKVVDWSRGRAHSVS